MVEGRIIRRAGPSAAAGTGEGVIYTTPEDLSTNIPMFSPTAPTRKISLTEGSVRLVGGQPFAGIAVNMGKPERTFEFLKAVPE